MLTSGISMTAELTVAIFIIYKNMNLLCAKQREFGIRNTIKKLNRQLEKVADSFGNITDI